MLNITSRDSLQNIDDVAPIYFNKKHFLFDNE